MNTVQESTQLLLQDITNTHNVHNQSNQICKNKQSCRKYQGQGCQNQIDQGNKQKTSLKKSRIDYSKILSLSHSQFKFNAVQPGYVVEQNFSLKLSYDLPKPTSLFLYIYCQDEKINSLDEYVFGIRKNCEYEYFDEFKFKANKKGQYSFVLGAKAPYLEQNTQINCKMFIWIDGQSQHSLQIPLYLKIKIPRIVTDKSLSHSQNQINNLIKLSLSKAKGKKQFKIPFKLLDTISEEMKLDVELIGLEDINGAECKQKSVFLKDRGIFLIVITVHFSADIVRRMHKAGSYILRKVLMLRNKANKLIYHFPVEITFKQSSKTTETAE